VSVSAALTVTSKGPLGATAVSGNSHGHQIALRSEPRAYTLVELGDSESIDRAMTGHSVGWRR
jgi:hypothetical protein